MERKPWICLDCRILMDSIDEDHCKCPKCGTEVWYQYSEPEKEEIEDLMQDNVVCHDTNISQSILMGGAVVRHGGGSKTKGRSNKKQLMQKPSTTQLYRELLSK